MRVLVTGAGSMLMGATVTELARRGDEVVCLQRRPLAFAPDTGIRSISADVRDVDAVTRAAEGCDAVIHGAARVGVVGTYDDFHSVNVGGTDAIITACRHHGIGRLVHVSTPSVAHVGEPLAGATATPATTGRPRARYAETKAIAEQHALAACDDSLAVVAIRPHLVWGPGDTQLVGRIVERARAGRLAIVGSGAALIDSTYVDNAADALLAAVDAIHPGARCAGRPYVIANGEPRTVAELFDGICAAAAVSARPRHVPVRAALVVGSVVERLWPIVRRDEPPITRFVAEQLATSHWFDPRPAHDDLGWSPRVSLAEGFARLARWYAER